MSVYLYQLCSYGHIINSENYHCTVIILIAFFDNTCNGINKLGVMLAYTRNRICCNHYKLVLFKYETYNEKKNYSTN